MSLKPDTFYLQKEDSSLYYASVSYHRNGTRLNEKSQWEITIEAAVLTFGQISLTQYTSISFS